MKNYPAIPINYYYAIKDYIVELDNQIWSLVDYIYNFTPNYQILNYTPQDIDITNSKGDPYYTLEELKESLKLISIENDTLTVNINYLPQGKGMYNNYSTFAKDKRYWTDNYNHKQIWPEGTVIISTAKNTLPIADAPDFRHYKTYDGTPNFFIARLSAAATFYRFSFNGNKPSFDWFYSANAEEQYGTTFLTTFINGQPRFIDKLGLQLYDKDYQQEFFSYLFSNQQLQPRIVTNIGSLWTDSYLLNHEIYWKEKENIIEECICDDISSISTSNLDNSKIPTYTIAIKDGKEPQKIYINLW